MIAAAMSDPTIDPENHVDADEKGHRRACEGQLADPVDRERHVALHHEDADESADEPEHGAPRRRSSARVRGSRPYWLTPPNSASPTSAQFMRRPRRVVVALVGVRRSHDDESSAGAGHEHGAPYRSLNVSDVSTWSGVPSVKRPCAM